MPWHLPHGIWYWVTIAFCLSRISQYVNLNQNYIIYITTKSEQSKVSREGVGQQKYIYRSLTKQESVVTATSSYVQILWWNNKYLSKIKDNYLELSLCAYKQIMSPEPRILKNLWLDIFKDGLSSKQNDGLRTMSWI